MVNKDTTTRWGLLPKCLVHNKMCPGYDRARCRDRNPCSYKEKKEEVRPE